MKIFYIILIKKLITFFMKIFFLKIIKQISLKHPLSFLLTIYIILGFPFYGTEIKCEIYKININ